MDQYLLKNKEYWEKGYNAPNVESYIFRFSGRILKPEFNLPANHERLLDFGCGQAASVNYFNSLGFDVRGCDISETDINVAKIRYPHLSNKLSVCAPDPKDNEYYGWSDGIRVVTAAQSFYYVSKADFHVMIEKIYNSMEKGGIIFATMMGTQHTYFKYSEPTDDEWLRVVNFEGRRVKMENYYIFFIKDEEDLKKKFSMFEPLHIGSYSMQLQDDETNNYHWTFVGRK